MSTEPQLTELTEDDLIDIAYGVALLGEGSLKSSLALIDVIKKTKPNEEKLVTLIDYKDVEDNKWAAAIGGLGSADDPDRVQPEELLENLSPTLSETFKLLGKKLGKTFDYVLGLELGANIFAAMLTASICQIKIVDGDGARRGVPELGMTTYASRIPTSPTTLSNVNMLEEARQRIVIYPTTSTLLDRLARGLVCTNEFTTGCFQIAILATYAISGRALKEKLPIIPSTISFARELGSILREQQGGKDPVKEVLRFFNDQSHSRGKTKCAFKLFQGTVDKIERQCKNGFDWAIATISNDKNRVVRVLAKIESLIAWCNDFSEPIAMGPDTICYLSEDGKPIGIGELEQGKKVTLLGVKANEQLRQGSILQSFLKSLNELGYYGSYVPIEELHSRWRKSQRD